MFFFPFLVIGSTIVMLYYAWTFTVLYTWFFVPLGLPAIKVAHAYGVMLIVGLFKTIKAEPMSPAELSAWVWNWAFRPVFALAVGAIIKYFFLS